MDKEHHERNLDLSFPDRQNPDYVPPRSVVGELPRGFRQALLDAFNTTIADELDHTPAHNWTTEKIYQFLVEEIQIMWRDEVRTKYPFGVGFDWLTPLIKSGDADVIVHLLDFILRDPGAGQAGDVIEGVFKTNRSAYAVGTSQDAEGRTIRYLYPARDEDSAEVVQAALELAAISDRGGVIRAREHIRKGSDYLNATSSPDLRAAVGAGFNALEAIAKEITGDPKKDDPVKAMLKIGKKLPYGLRHPIVVKLCGYAHKRRHDEVIETDPDDAQLFLDICTLIMGVASTKLTTQPRGEDNNDNAELH